MAEIKTYETGAKRDSDADSEAFALVPLAGIRAVARTLAEGAKKYEPHNWRKGFRWVQTMNHVLRHCYLWLARDGTEDHLGHAIAGLMFLCEFEETHQPLDDRYEAAPQLPKLTGGALPYDAQAKFQDYIAGRFPGR